MPGFVTFDFCDDKTLVLAGENVNVPSFVFKYRMAALGDDMRRSPYYFASDIGVRQCRLKFISFVTNPRSFYCVGGVNIDQPTIWFFCLN